MVDLADIKQVNKGDRGTIYSQKSHGIVKYENKMELLLLIMFEASPLIRAFSYESLSIPYILDGERHIFNPDYVLYFLKYKAIWEAKYQYKTGGRETIAKMKAAEVFGNRHGFKEVRKVVWADLPQIFMELEISNNVIKKAIGF